ncbi:MAG: hypothetical protein ACLFWF_06035 [Alphaproteobacteria bacterium]
MGDPFRWAAVVMLAALFLVFAAYNGVSAWQRWVRRAPAPSWAPVAGGAFGLMAVLTLPAGTFAERLWFAWIPLLLDVSIPVTVAALWKDLSRRK